MIEWIKFVDYLGKRENSVEFMLRDWRVSQDF